MNHCWGRRGGPNGVSPVLELSELTPTRPRNTRSPRMSGELNTRQHSALVEGDLVRSGISSGLCWLLQNLTSWPPVPPSSRAVACRRSCPRSHCGDPSPCPRAAGFAGRTGTGHTFHTPLQPPAPPRSERGVCPPPPPPATAPSSGRPGAAALSHRPSGPMPRSPCEALLGAWWAPTAPPPPPPPAPASGGPLLRRGGHDATGVVVFPRGSGGYPQTTGGCLPISGNRPPVAGGE